LTKREPGVRVALVKCLVAVCAALSIFAGACGSESRRESTPFKPKVGDIKLLSLPAEGLAVNRATGVELMGLDGRRYGFLTGFSAIYSGFTSFFPLDPSRSRLSGNGKGYLLDAVNGYLLLTRRDRGDLGYGFEYRDISIWNMTDADKEVAALGDPNDEAESRTEIYRDGKPFLYPGGGIALTYKGDFISAGSLTFAGSKLVPGVRSRLIDLRSGSMEALPAGCIVYGRRAGVLNALCTGKHDEHGRQTLSLKRKDGESWSVVYAWPLVEDGEWHGGVLSPDERHLVVSRGVPCDTEMVEIADARGPERMVLGEGTALGWSASGKAIVYLRGKANPGCDTREPYSGAVYAVDPVTLERTLIVRTSAAKFWSKAKA
jgi:hypothetical protein